MNLPGVPLGEARELVTAIAGADARLAIAPSSQALQAVGHDLAVTCLNDLAASGARPLSFQYRTLSGVVPAPEPLERAMAAVCALMGCSFLGGATDLDPDPAAPPTLAGVAVGLREADLRVGRSQPIRGDVLVGLPTPSLSPGSLARALRLLAEHHWRLDLPVGGTTLGEALLQPATLHAPRVLDLLGRYRVKASAHLHGGLQDLYQALPTGRDFRILEGSWPVPEIYAFLARGAGLAASDLRQAFNLGLGMVLVISPERVADMLLEVPDARAIGEMA